MTRCAGVMLKAKTNKRTQEKYDTQVSVLQQRNKDLKKKIKELDQTKTRKWTAFKREFNRDMDELGRAIRDIGVDNAK